MMLPAWLKSAVAWAGVSWPIGRPVPAREEETALFPYYERADRTLPHTILIAGACLTVFAYSHAAWVHLLLISLFIWSLVRAVAWLCPATFASRMLFSVATPTLALLSAAWTGAGPEIDFLFLISTLLLVIYRDARIVALPAVTFFVFYLPLLIYQRFPIRQIVLTALAMVVVAALASFIAEWLRQQTVALALQYNEYLRMKVDLVKARIEAERAEKAKNEFLANLSHEVRTPMNGVLGMTRLLLDTRMSREQQELGETLERSTRALMGVVNEILDFARLEAGKMELNPVPFDFHSPFEDIFDLLGSIAEGKGLELLCEFDSRIPAEVVGDAPRLRHVLINLVGNALKFTTHGHVLVTTSLEEDSPAGLVIRTEVVDSGPGIADEDPVRLFRPFTQGHGEVVRKYGGLGLGLAIAKRLIEMMGGEIGLKSIPGKGARFWFTIRCTRGPSTKTVDYSPVFGKRILVVCQYPFSAMILVNQLRQWGIDAFAAFNADQAISELVRARQLDSRYHMAIIDGADGARSSQAWYNRLNAIQPLPAIELLPFTRLGAPEAPTVAFIASATKPLRPRLLLATITRILVPSSLPEEQLMAPEGLAPHNFRILLVEDNLVNQRVAKRLVEKMGYTVDLAANGKEAVAKVFSSNYDAVLMDCHMPEMGGLEATQLIRSREAAGRRVPIIALTAYVLDNDRLLCFAAGMDDHIAKPVQVDDLRAVLERWVPVKHVHT